MSKRGAFTIATVIALALASVPAQAGPVVRRTAPFDFGCRRTPDTSRCEPLEAARHGQLVHGVMPSLSINYGPPWSWVGCCVVESWYAGINLRFSRRVKFRSVISSRVHGGEAPSGASHVCAALWPLRSRTTLHSVCAPVALTRTESFRFDVPRLPAGRYRLAVYPRSAGYGATVVELKAITYTYDPLR